MGSNPTGATDMKTYVLGMKGKLLAAEIALEQAKRFREIGMHQDAQVNLELADKLINRPEELEMISSDE